MVLGIFKAESIIKVKNNPYYGDFKKKTVHSTVVENEKYEGLVPPKNGIRITVNNLDGDKVTFTLGKYWFTGEYEEEYDEKTVEYNNAFCWRNCIVGVTVDYLGQLISLNVWYSSGDFEDGNEPDAHYEKRSKGIKWELIDM